MIKIGKEWVNYTYNQSKVKLMENSITANNDEIIAVSTVLKVNTSFVDWLKNFIFGTPITIRYITTIPFYYEKDTTTDNVSTSNTNSKPRNKKRNSSNTNS